MFCVFLYTVASKCLHIALNLRTLIVNFVCNSVVLLAAFTDFIFIILRFSLTL